jgi:hypothetical protein
VKSLEMLNDMFPQIVCKDLGRLAGRLQDLRL